MRITIAVPVAHVADANQLAQATGQSEADGRTFDLAPEYQDGAGGFYRVASGIFGDRYLETVSAPLKAPEWSADMKAAARAQALVRIGGKADPAAIVAVIGGDVGKALAELGLTALDRA